MITDLKTPVPKPKQKRKFDIEVEIDVPSYVTVYVGFEDIKCKCGAIIDCDIDTSDYEKIDILLEKHACTFYPIDENQQKLFGE